MSRTGRYAATNAVNDLEDGEAWPEEGLAHRELDMVELRLNDLVLRNAPSCNPGIGTSMIRRAHSPSASSKLHVRFVGKIDPATVANVVSSLIALDLTQS